LPTWRYYGVTSTTCTICGGTRRHGCRAPSPRTSAGGPASRGVRRA